DATSWHELLHHYDRFAPSFVTQPNGPQCTKIVRNAPKHDRVQWGGTGAFVAKNFEATSCHKLLHQFRPFCTEFRNSTKRLQNAPKFFIQTTPKHEFRVQWGGLGALVAKTSDATSWHELLHQFGPFCTEFRKSTKPSQMHQNCTNPQKHEFRVQWGGSGAFIVKNSDATSWHELLHQFGPFCTEFQKSTKRSQLHQNCTNAPKHEFRVQWGGSGAFIVKNSDATS